MLVIKQLQPNSQKLPTVSLSRKKQEVKKFFELAPGVSGGVQRAVRAVSEGSWQVRWVGHH